MSKIRFQFPVNYIYISQPFKGSAHTGIDLGWQSGICGGQKQPIYAPADGKVVKVVKKYKTADLNSMSYGNYVLIKHSNGYQTRSAHLLYDSIKVKKGDKVKRGQRIATMGTTGHSYGPHDHFEVIKNGKFVDPLKYTGYTKDMIIAKCTKKEYDLNKYPE